jgi:hypothetical protein
MAISHEQCVFDRETAALVELLIEAAGREDGDDRGWPHAETASGSSGAPGTIAVVKEGCGRALVLSPLHHELRIDAGTVPGTQTLVISARLSAGRFLEWVYRGRGLSTQDFASLLAEFWIGPDRTAKVLQFKPRSNAL